MYVCMFVCVYVYIGDVIFVKGDKTAIVFIAVTENSQLPTVNIR